VSTVPDVGLREDRARAAYLSGVVKRWANEITRRPYDGIEVDAMAEIRTVTSNPHVATLAAVGHLDDVRPGARDLLVKAGADLEEARRLRDGMGPGWNPPQATPERDRT
jgi:hypothetical protein